eukprot:CCRYP_014936-RA/>CCRYP_014936-RA protein AED:0.33 eAED:0.37 QI:4830/0.66/0.71/1/0/0/7/0/252
MSFPIGARVPTRVSDTTNVAPIRFSEATETSSMSPLLCLIVLMPPPSGVMKVMDTDFSPPLQNPLVKPSQSSEAGEKTRRGKVPMVARFIPSIVASNGIGDDSNPRNPMVKKPSLAGPVHVSVCCSRSPSTSFEGAPTRRFPMLLVPFGSSNHPYSVNLLTEMYVIVQEKPDFPASFENSLLSETLTLLMDSNESNADAISSSDASYETNSLKPLPRNETAKLPLRIPRPSYDVCDQTRASLPLRSSPHTSS